MINSLWLGFRAGSGVPLSCIFGHVGGSVPIDVDGCSGFDIVRWCRTVFCCITCVLVCSWCDVVLFSMLRSMGIASVWVGGGVANLPVSVGLVASCCPTVFVGRGVG